MSKYKDSERKKHTSLALLDDMPALKVLGQRLKLIAGDDLRWLARWIICFRIAQCVLLIVAVVALSRVESSSDDVDVLWFFWGFSTVTVLSALMLEIVM